MSAKSVMRQSPMRFWKIDELKSELAAGDLPARKAIQYYLVAGALSLLLYGLPLYEENFWDVVGTFGDAVLLVAGGYVCYRANGGPEGHDLLGRFVSIGWVLGIRLAVFVMVPAIVAGLVFESYLFGGIPDDTTAFEAVLILVVEAIFYWRLSTHIDDVADGSAA